MRRLVLTVLVFLAVGLFANAMSPLVAWAHAGINQILALARAFARSKSPAIIFPIRCCAFAGHSNRWAISC
jgi:hypothetical protein